MSPFCLSKAPIVIRTAVVQLAEWTRSNQSMESIQTIDLFNRFTQMIADLTQSISPNWLILTGQF